MTQPPPCFTTSYELSSPRIKFRNWCVVINNPVANDYITFNHLPDKKNFKRGIAQLEKSHCLHIQAYLEFVSPIHINWLKRKWPRGHFERRRKTAVKAWKYCEKADTAVLGPKAWSWEHGTAPTGGQGTRTDLVQGVDIIRRGGGLLELADLHPDLVVKYHRGFQVLINLWAKPRKIGPIDIRVYWGDPETGKTRSAWEEFPDLYCLPLQHGNGLWFNNYTGQNVVLFDEFEGEMPLTSLLRITDIYPLTVQTKGGFVSFLPHIIIITSNSHPKTWYDYTGREVKWKALKRRIKIKEFKVLKGKKKE